MIACVPGRVILFFKASVGPGPHCADSEQKSLAFIEEYWRMPVQPGDALTSEFNCVRLYSTVPAVYYVIDAWRILGPAPIIRNPVHPSIPHGFLPRKPVGVYVHGTIHIPRKNPRPDEAMGAGNGL